MIRCVLAGVLVLAASPLFGQTFTTTRVAQTGDVPPGSMLPFGNSFASGFPAMHSTGVVSFIGSVSSVRRVYSGVGGGPLNLFVDNGSLIPEGGGATFLDFGTSSSYGASGVAFQGANATTSPTLQGIYLSNGSTVSRIADSTLTAPGQSVNFSSFAGVQIPSVNGDNVAFRANYSGGSGLYARFGGNLVAVADTSTPIPAGIGNFTSLNSNQVLSGSLVVFRGSGSSSQQGIYLRDLSSGSNPLIRVTDKTLTLPGTSSIITNIFEPTVSGNKIQFIGEAGSGTQRVVAYTWNGSSSSPSFTEAVVSKLGDPVPGQGSLLFTGYQGFVSSDGNNTAFIGRFNDGTARTGIYFHDGTDLYRIIDTTQFLDSKLISTLLLGPDAVAGNFVTFQAIFTDSTSAIYRVEFTPVPEPGTVFGILVFTVVVYARRKRKNLNTAEQ